MFRKVLRLLIDTEKPSKPLVQKWYSAKTETQDLGRSVQKAYKQDGKPDKNKVISVLECFRELYDTAINPHPGYYKGNLIGIGKIEGDLDDVLGTLEGAIDRTIRFIDMKDDLSLSNCAFYVRNLKVILEQEKFERPPEEIVEPYLPVLEDIAAGNVSMK